MDSSDGFAGVLPGGGNTIPGAVPDDAFGGLFASTPRRTAVPTMLAEEYDADVGGSEQAREHWRIAKERMLMFVRSRAPVDSFGAAVMRAVNTRGASKLMERALEKKLKAGGGAREFTWTMDHVRVLYLIRCYTDTKDGTSWLRKLPLMVLAET